MEVASELLDAAGLLWTRVDPERPSDDPGLKLLESIRYLPPYELLCAFAVENALKAALIEKIWNSGATPIVEAAGPASVRVWGHDLQRLAARVGMPLSAAERVILYNLKQAIEWSGRYPAPRKKSFALIRRTTHEEVRQFVQKCRAIVRYHKEGPRKRKVTPR